MLATLHTITDAIVIRKSLKWKNCILADDEKIDCNNIFENMQSQFNKYLNKLTKDIKNTAIVTNCIRNIYSIKARLQEAEWPIPCSLSSNEQKVYMHDFNFFLMLCGILKKATTLFKGYFLPKDRLAYTQTLPVIQGNPRRIVQTINLLPPTKWVHIIHLEQEKNKFYHALELLDQKITQLDISSSQYSFLSAYRAYSKSYPDNLAQEKHMVKIYGSITQIIDEYNNKDNLVLIRELIFEGFKIGWIHTNTNEKYLELMNNSNPNKLYINAEIKRLEYIHKYCMGLLSKGIIKNERVLGCIQKLITQLQLIECEENTSTEFIEWTYHPKEFVKTIQSYISKGYVNLKGSTDMQTIVKFINRFVKVRKLNNSGNLKYDSLLSYFKKVSNGDMV